MTASTATFVNIGERTNVTGSARFRKLITAGDYAAALDVHDKLMPLHVNLFMEPSPSPVKYALSLLGKMSDKTRLPMVPVSDATRTAVRSAMVHAGLVN
jgi:4-hydroxy-tetrahydrodipicolinate synthase